MKSAKLDAAAARALVLPGKKLSLSRHAPDWLPQGLENDGGKEAAEAALAESRARLAKAQELLFADDRHAILVILQGLDAAGKDGIVKHVLAGVNPMGCRIAAFKAPLGEELEHDFLWRFGRHLPEKGLIGIFNRSYYEEVLVVRVHPEFLERQKLPPGPRGPAFWQARHRAIRDYEQRLSENGTTVLKFFLNVSREEQAKRLIERIEDPAKFWKFNAADVSERRHWGDYRRYFEETLAATSSKQAPWYVIPADRKWFARTLVAHILVKAIEGLKLQQPKPGATDRQALIAAKRELLKG